MLSILCVTLTIKVKVGIPKSFKVGRYRQKITGSSHLKRPSRSRVIVDSRNGAFSSPEPPGFLSRWRLGTRTKWPPFPRAKAPPAKRDRRLWGREWKWRGFFFRK